MDQLLEVLGRSDVQTGIALGFVLGVGFQIVLSFLFSVFFPGSDKARIGSQASLVTKLQENGYSVYTPISTSVTDLVLSEPLEEEEEFELLMGKFFVVGPHGNAITKMHCYSTTTDQIAEYRRAKFQVIKGGKEDAPN